MLKWSKQSLYLLLALCLSSISSHASAMFMPDEDDDNTNRREQTAINGYWSLSNMYGIARSTTNYLYPAQNTDQRSSAETPAPELQPGWWAQSRQAISDWTNSTAKNSINHIFDNIDNRYLAPVKTYAKPAGYTITSLVGLYIAYRVGMHRGKKENIHTYPNQYYYAQLAS